MSEVAGGNGVVATSSSLFDQTSLVATVLRARTTSVSYRNTGFLLRNGYFATAGEIAAHQSDPTHEEASPEDVWSCAVHNNTPSSDDGSADPDGKRAVLFHVGTT